MPTLPVEGEVGDRIKIAREYRGLKGDELAKHVGVYGKQTVSFWETGAKTPDPTTIQKIANALDVPLSYLMYGEEFDVEEQQRAAVQTQILQALLRLEERVTRTEKKVDRALKTMEQILATMAEWE